MTIVLAIIVLGLLVYIVYDKKDIILKVTHDKVLDAEIKFEEAILSIAPKPEINPMFEASISAMTIEDVRKELKTDSELSTYIKTKTIPEFGE